jgi:regulator of protease activity HflC (stomatin/prohibitin superfamily)
VTLGKVKEVNLDEGLQFKLPYVQRIVDMKVMLEKEQVQENAASSDLQEITTTLTVHFNVMPSSAWMVYQTMRQDYHDLLLRPVIQEDLKATTAKFTAEDLIITRTLLVDRLTEKLRASLLSYGIYVQTVNFVDFQFSQAFRDAIEAKVTAEQEALQAKNVLVRIEYEAQQKIIQAEAEKNATIIAAEADARRVEIAALAEAFKVTTEANATADAIQMITDQMTPEYAQYLHLMQWDGKYPTTMLGSLEDLGVIIDTTP